MSVHFQVGSFAAAIAAQGEMRERHRRAHELRMVMAARAAVRRSESSTPRVERGPVGALAPLASLRSALTASAAAMTRVVAVARLAVGG